MLSNNHILANLQLVTEIVKCENYEHFKFVIILSDFNFDIDAALQLIIHLFI